MGTVTFVAEVAVLHGQQDNQQADQLANDLANVLALPMRPVHADPAATDLVAAIVSDLRRDSLVVMETENENRWSGKQSVAEHVADQWGGISVMLGPRCRRGPLADTGGPILVALDQSAAAERAMAPALAVAKALDRAVLLATIVPEGPESEAARTAATSYLDSLSQPGIKAVVICSSDPVSALRDEASRAMAALLVVTSKGDRSTPRLTISRTSSGLAGEASQPVMIVGPNWVQ